MSKKTYEIIPLNKNIDGKQLMENVGIYMYSRLKECQIETNVSDNTYTILVSTSARIKEIKSVYITVEMILHKESCAVYFNSSKARPMFNFALALAAAPVALPASGLLMGSSLLRLWNHSEFKKDVINYIRAYVS